MCACWIHECLFQGSPNSVVSFSTLCTGDTLHALHHGSMGCSTVEGWLQCEAVPSFAFLIWARGLPSPFTKGELGQKDCDDEGVTSSLLAMCDSLVEEYKFSNQYKIIGWLGRDLKDHLFQTLLPWARAPSPKPIWSKPHQIWPTAFGNFLVLAHQAAEKERLFITTFSWSIIWSSDGSVSRSNFHQAEEKNIPR